MIETNRLRSSETIDPIGSTNYEIQIVNVLGVSQSYSDRLNESGFEEQITKLFEGQFLAASFLEVQRLKELRVVSL